MKPADLVRMLLENRDGLFGFILALTHDREAAEEIFQDVGLVVVEEARKETRVERFLPWAHEIARRRVAEHFRKSSKRRGQHLESLDEVVAQSFEENAGPHLDRQEHLADCIEDLPPAQRGLIEQRYRDQESIRGIAITTSSTEGAVKVALWKARRRLEQCIEGKLGGAD